MLEVQHLQGTRSKISWLLRIRALVIACLFLGLFLAPALGFMPRNFIGLYIAILSFLVVWSVYTWRWILFGSTPVTDRDMLMQLIVDLVVGVLVLAMTGGIYNPLCILFLVLVLVAAMILEKKHLALFMLLFFASLAYLQWRPDVAHLEFRGVVTRSIVFVSLCVVGLIITLVTNSFRTHIKAAQFHLNLLKQKEERLDKLKLAGAMAAGFSHEFSSPLYSLRLNLIRIHRRAPSEESEAALGSVDDCERILHNLTENSLKSRELKLEKVPLESLLQQWLLEYERPLGRGELQFSSELDEEVRSEIPKLPLKQCFFDLLDNAFETPDELGREPSSPLVLVQLRREPLSPQFVQVRVVNWGMPVPQMIREKWGEPFVTTKVNGTGLGLFNAITLLRAMGGDLIADSPQSGQTRFSMLIPT